jgi:hypothetical protein
MQGRQRPRRRVPQHLAHGGRVRMHVGRSSDLRAVARAPFLLASLPSSVQEPVLLTRSFPITAAGQSRN